MGASVTGSSFVFGFKTRQCMNGGNDRHAVVSRSCGDAMKVGEFATSWMVRMAFADRGMVNETIG